MPIAKLPSVSDCVVLTVITYLWGDKYSPDDARKLEAGLRRGMKEPYRFAVVTDNVDRAPDLPMWEIPQEDIPLTKMQGCFARLRLFDPEWLAGHGIAEGERVVSLDLDNVITGDLYPLFYRPEPFMILTGANATNPCPYNGSVWMVRAGYRPDVWSDFTLEAADKVRHAAFADDQSWFAHKLTGVTGWPAGSGSGIYGFQKPGWPKGEALPKDARIVAFFGWRSPEKFKHLDWVRQYWG